jgi:hypothetical protein
VSINIVLIGLGILTPGKQHRLGFGWGNHSGMIS